MRWIPYYEYTYSIHENALETLHGLADRGAEAVLCRIRVSRDHVPFVHHETTLGRLCLREEQIADLSYREIDAMMCLCGYHILPLVRLFDEYDRSTKLILHFRGFRPDASIVSRVVRDERFSFASDSVEQVRVIAGEYKNHSVIGFASHIPIAVELAHAGAAAVCLHGRDIRGYAPEQLSLIPENVPYWIEPPRSTLAPGESMSQWAEEIGCNTLIVPPDRIDNP